MHALVVDIVEPGKATGFVSGPDDFPISATREGVTWYIFGGISDEYRAQGSTLAIAVRRLAREIGLTGTAEIGNDRTQQRATITLDH